MDNTNILHMNNCPFHQVVVNKIWLKMNGWMFGSSKECWWDSDSPCAVPSIWCLCWPMEYCLLQTDNNTLRLTDTGISIKSHNTTVPTYMQRCLHTHTILHDTLTPILIQSLYAVERVQDVTSTTTGTFRIVRKTLNFISTHTIIVLNAI